MLKSIAALFDAYGSDKNTAHSYGDLYDQLFNRERFAVKNVLEIGVHAGASLRAFADYFENAAIYGIDIALNYTPQHPRIHVCAGDASNVEDIAANFTGKQFDIIIDDGSHVYEQQRQTFAILRAYLRPGGYYIIEDIVEYARLCADDEFNQQFCVLDRRLVKNDPYDILLIYKKPVKNFNGVMPVSSSMLPAYANIPAFCINLDYRADRWAAVLQQFERLNWAVTRWPAVQVTQPVASTLSLGAIGCLASHRGIWQYAVDNALPVIAVFEDDAVFPSDFIAVFSAVCAELPADWQLLHLHSMAAHGAELISPRVLKYHGQSGWGSHGYIITNYGCRAALDLNDPNAPVDDLLTRVMWHSGITPYGIVDKYTLCFQAGQDSDIPATQAVGHWRAHLEQHGR